MLIKWPHRLRVRIAGFQSVNTSSNLVEVTILIRHCGWNRQTRRIQNPMPIGREGSTPSGGTICAQIHTSIMMKKNKLLLLMFFLIFCTSCYESSFCNKDTECASGRVCSFGSCVDREPVQNIANPQAKDCGKVNIQCNCATTNAYPGTVSMTNNCDSGKQIFQVCPGICEPGFGVPWQTTCYCE